MRADDELRRQAQAILDSDPRTANYHLKVRVNGGVAQVTGIVDTLSEKEQVGRIMSGIRDLRGFENGVSISTDGSIIDEDVMEEVNEELRTDPEVNQARVGARSIKGTVFLMGTVENPEEEQAAIRAASRARGVTSVISQLRTENKNYDINDLEAVFQHQVNNDRENEGNNVRI